MMYACGLRVPEANHLQACDIDTRRMVVHVGAGKGQQDRDVPLLWNSWAAKESPNSAPTPTCAPSQSFKHHPLPV